MTPRAPRIGAAVAGLLFAGLTTAVAAAQAVNVPLSPEAWIATDSTRFVSYLGRPSLYINRGVALVHGVSMENGTLDLDLAASDTTTFLGVAFRAATPRFSNVLFLRPGASGTEEAARNRWIHVRVELDGPVARLYVDTATAPTLVVPRLAASSGAGPRYERHTMRSDGCSMPTAMASSST